MAALYQNLVTSLVAKIWKIRSVQPARVAPLSGLENLRRLPCVCRPAASSLCFCSYDIETQKVPGLESAELFCIAIQWRRAWKLLRSNLRAPFDFPLAFPLTARLGFPLTSQDSRQQ